MFTNIHLFLCVYMCPLTVDGRKRLKGFYIQTAYLIGHGERRKGTSISSLGNDYPTVPRTVCVCFLQISLWLRIFKCKTSKITLGLNQQCTDPQGQPKLLRLFRSPVSQMKAIYLDILKCYQFMMDFFFLYYFSQLLQTPNF